MEFAVDILDILQEIICDTLNIEKFDLHFILIILLYKKINYITLVIKEHH